MLPMVVALAPWPALGERAGAARLTTVTAAALVALTVSVRPVVADGLTARGLAAHFNAAGRVPTHVWIVDEGVGSFVFYLRGDLRKGLVRGQVSRISRFSTPDILSGPAADVLAVASDRLAGLAQILELDGVPPPAPGAFLVLPLGRLRARAAVR